MTSIMDSATDVDAGRSQRLGSFDQMSSLRPSMTFGSGFGVGRSAWNTNASIWRTASRFTDGPAEEEIVSDTRSRTSHNKSYTTNKTGSGSLLHSSESDIRSARSNVPWDTAAAANQSIISRPQNELISPTRQKTVGNITNGQATNPRLAYRPVYPPNNSQGNDFLGPSNQHDSQSELSNTAFRSFERNGFPEFQPSIPNNQRNEQFNNSSHNSNGMVSVKPLQRQSELPLEDRPSKSYANGSYEAHARSAAAALNSRFAAAYPPDHPGHLSNPGQFQGLGDMDTQNDSMIQQDNPLTMTFNKMSLDNGQSYWNDSAMVQPHQHLRSSYDTNGTTGRDLNKARQSYQADERSNGQTVTESSQELDYQYLPNYYRTLSFGDQATVSPTASEYRRSLPSPFYSTTGTPPTGPESMRSASGSGLSSRASNGHSAILDRKLRSLEPYPFDQLQLQHNPLHAHIHYPPPSYDYSNYASSMRMNPLANPYTLSGYLNGVGVPHTPRYPSREHDTSQIIRSAVLEDFRTNSKTNKRYELKDIYNHVVEFSGDQHGSRFIQQKLETANSDEKDQIFTEILPDSLQLMTDVFGNYVIQKLFEHGNQSQKKLLANQMKGHVFNLSLQMYGCRVVQKALEHVLTDQQASMVKELETHVLKCVKDQNGNHVIQKAIERVPAEHVHFIVEAFHEQVQRLATHPYGCRVIQRMLEHCERPAKQAILHEMHQHVAALITDQFGNYVIQHVIERGDPEDKYRVVAIVQAQLLMYSKHKFASNVVEKSIEFSEESQRRDILHQLTVTNERGESPVFGLLRDQYGNYVIQKVLSQLQGTRRQALVDQIKAQLVNLKKFSYGKQITAIEKLIFDNDNSSLSGSSQDSAIPSADASTAASTVGGRSTPPPPQALKPQQAHDTQIALPLPSGQPRM